VGAAPAIYRPSMAPPGGPQRQVLVVGAGPAGLVAAIALALYGIDVVVIDRRTSTSTLSRALVISTRGMEIFRAWGLEDEIRSGAAGVESRAWVTPTLASREGSEMPLGYPTASEAALVSPTRPAWAPQDHLEPLLLGLLRSLPTAEVRFGSELLSLSVGADGADAVVRSGGAGDVTHLRARYVIGADGAHSTVRGEAKIPMIGRDDLAEYHRVEFVAALGEIVGGRRYGLYVITNPEGSGVLTPRGKGDRWGLSREWAPGQPRLVDCNEAQLAALIAAAVGAPAPGLRIERVSSFSFAAQIAERYREGPVFLVGDAAHRMTPRGGTGMNTAIQDAFDIAWKIAWVLKGWSAEGLLASYEADRRPVGLHNVQRAGQPGGAERAMNEALPWDLNGRLAHVWLTHGGKTVSSLDLVGDGLTLVAGPREPRWRDAEVVGSGAPLDVHHVDEATAAALGIEPSGAHLLRPDGRPVAACARFTARIDLATTTAGPEA
jgi:putative polyketide hydroxylase